MSKVCDEGWHCDQESLDNKDEAAPEGWPVTRAFGLSVCAKLTDNGVIIRMGTCIHQTNHAPSASMLTQSDSENSPKVIKVLEITSVEGTNARN